MNKNSTRQPLLSLRNLRVTLLLCALLFFGLTALHQLVYTRSWNQPLQAVVLPINADGHLQTADYIASLQTRHFTEIENWAAREGKRHNLTLEHPVEISLGPQITQLPPPFPSNDHPFYVVLWGLRFRWWAYRNTPDIELDSTTVRLFVMYHDTSGNKPLAHSLGMQKGLMGLVHVFADSRQTAQNNIVIAHELLHTVGAIDKYQEWGSPVFPVGYANPQRQPLFPQRYAEIMAGRIPVSYGRFYMAESLKSVIINEYTAEEINWLD